MILSNKLKKGKSLLREEIAQDFDVSEAVVSLAFSKLKKEGLVIIKWGKGSLVAPQKFCIQFGEEDGMRTRVTFVLSFV